VDFPKNRIEDALGIFQRVLVRELQYPQPAGLGGLFLISHATRGVGPL